ncbi:nuclear transport factor 2 family protein [Corallococcus llansteffanensis]|uniref:Nuclear transport factor 2 family protein n=2 Tax=Corallococcus llansteffanensis TaxID=2316731 RepID=A0A3A8P666_9BACT|nr:nuclear transport factor 2 family protein [Corallococcus llansteffanensis]
MHPHSQLITDFYSAFQRRDADGMAACYHPDVEFNDAVFQGLRYAGATSMWRMLLERGKDLELTFSDVQADDRTGRAHWDARYTFSQTGRKVLNRIDATFEFADGKIVRHTDHFPFWTWSRQALGPVGFALGWTPLLHNKVRAQGAAGLRKYMRERGIQGE